MKRTNLELPSIMKYSVTFLIASLLTPLAALARQPVDCVNPLIGAGSLEGTFSGFHGKCFPGAATPAGMVQLSPDTITGGDNGGGYSVAHTTVQGFSMNHMSGVGWYGDLGNFLITPTTGPLKTYAGQTGKPGSGYLSAIDKTTEVARAAYYAVTLSDYQVRAELTAAPHSGILRFTFPQNEQSRIQIDLARRIGGTSLHQTVKVVGDRAIEGLIDCTPDGGGWGHGGGGAHYTVYYYAEFSHPLKNFGVWSATLPKLASYRDVLNHPEFIKACETPMVIAGCREQEGQHLGFYSEFPTKLGEQVTLKVGISYVSLEGARANLMAEIPEWDFAGVQQQARQAWTNKLGRIMVEGGTQDQQTIFYTAMYHSMIDPRIFADVNGDYPGGESPSQVHHTKSFTKRTIFSGWDVYRSQFPLLTLIAPEIINDEINSWIELAEQNQKFRFDRWEMLNAYSGCMVGSPSVIVIHDAYRKGIRSYDVAKAYQYSVNTADTCFKQGKGQSTTLDHTPASERGSISTTFENSFADWNIAQLAASLGKVEDAARYQQRSMAYKLLFNPELPWFYGVDEKSNLPADASHNPIHPEWKGWFHEKNQDGQWFSRKGKEGQLQPWGGLVSHHGCVESSVYQQGWQVPHDVPGLMTLLGGKDLFIAKLTDFFEQAPKLEQWNNYMNISNEPSHLIPFLFNRAGAPWLTQKWIRRLCTEAYTANYNGLPGDEDEGQMSAWFVLAASGIHQACPGDTRFEIFSPLFDKVTLKLDPKFTKGGTFTIHAKNNSPQNVYIQSARLNHKILNRCWLDYQEIIAGGTLELELGPNPNKNWGIAR